jgi:hypothetical protein
MKLLFEIGYNLRSLLLLKDETGYLLLSVRLNVSAYFFTINVSEIMLAWQIADPSQKNRSTHTIKHFIRCIKFFQFSGIKNKNSQRPTLFFY